MFSFSRQDLPFFSSLSNAENSFVNSSPNPSAVKRPTGLERDASSSDRRASSSARLRNWNAETVETSHSLLFVDNLRDNVKSPVTSESSHAEQTATLIGSSNDKSSPADNEMKTEFVNFRKKQFETGHVENVVRDPQRESKTKKYSEKKKYENEWNRLTAIGDVESVMDRASHFEEIDRDKFARLKSKLPNSTSNDAQFVDDEFFFYELHPNTIVNSSSNGRTSNRPTDGSPMSFVNLRGFFSLFSTIDRT